MNNKTFIYKVLSSKILVFLGLISYSSYLYHFPIFTFIEYSNLLEDTLAIKLAIILLILFISFLSWKYIEKPFRDREKISFKIFILILFILYVIVFSLGALNFYNKGFKSRYAEDFKNFSINFNIKELEEETALFKENLRLKNEFYSNNKKKVLIIGNSVAIDLLMSFDQNIDFFNDYEFREYYFKPQYLFENSYKEKLEVTN